MHTSYIVFSPAGKWLRIPGHFSLTPPSWTDLHTLPRPHIGIDPNFDYLELLYCEFQKWEVMTMSAVDGQPKKHTNLSYKATKYIEHFSNLWLLLVYIRIPLLQHRFKQDLTMKLYDIFSASPLMQFVNILSNNSHSPSFLVESHLKFCNGIMRLVWFFGQHHLSPITIKFPHKRWISVKCMRCR